MNRKGESWLTFAGLMLILAGALLVLHGVWAVTNDEDADQILALFSRDLNLWGWIYMVVGALTVVAGFSVFARAQWAVKVGIVVALVGATLNMLLIFDFPTTTLILVGLNVLVVYGLVVYGLGDEPAQR